MVQLVKSPPANTGDTQDVGSIPGSGRSSGEEKWQLIPVSLPRKFHGQKSLAGFSPWGRKESDITEYHVISSLWYRNKDASGLVKHISQFQQSKLRNSNNVTY